MSGTKMTLQEFIQKMRNRIGTSFDGEAELTEVEMETLLKIIELQGEALENARESISHSENFINEQVGRIFPGIETCGDCEGPCSCKYPDGFIELNSLQYHCAGSQIQIDEFKSEIQKLLETI